MDTCTILIPNVNTPYLLYGSISQIEKYTNNVDWEVMIVDQSDESIHNEIKEKYKNHPRVNVIKLPKIDAGFPIDYAARNSTKEFLCSLDVDAFPIHPNWLYLPIELIKQFNLSFVGQETGLGKHEAYNKSGIFCHINNYFRVSRTDLAKKVSENAGFCRYQNRDRTGLNFAKVNWKENHSDNGVIAQWWSDQEKLGDKVSLSMNKIIGMTNEFGVYGMCIDDLVFHLVFGYHPDTITDSNKSLGKQYLELETLIKKEGLTQSIINKLLIRLKPHETYSSRKISILGEVYQLDPKHEVYLKIEELKNV